MTERQTKRTYESALPNNLVAPKRDSDKEALLDGITPAKYNRMNEKQRRELLSRLIDYLKSI